MKYEGARGGGLFEVAGDSDDDAEKGKERCEI